MTQQECLKFSVPAAATTDAQVLQLGGHYVIDSMATGSGTIDLEKLMPDGETWAAVITQITSGTPAEQVVILAPGQYRVVAATFTDTFVTVARASVG